MLYGIGSDAEERAGDLYSQCMTGGKTLPLVCLQRASEAKCEVIDCENDGSDVDLDVVSQPPAPLSSRSHATTTDFQNDIVLTCRIRKLSRGGGLTRARTHDWPGWLDNDDQQVKGEMEDRAVFAAEKILAECKAGGGGNAIEDAACDAKALEAVAKSTGVADLDLDPVATKLALSQAADVIVCGDLGACMHVAGNLPKGPDRVTAQEKCNVDTVPLKMRQLPPWKRKKKLKSGTHLGDPPCAGGGGGL